MRKLKWPNHSDLAILRQPTVGRTEYLDYMTFQRNDRPLFTEIFGPMVGLKEEWEEQGATPEELNFSAFRYRCEHRTGLKVTCFQQGGHPGVEIENTDEHHLWRDGLGRTMKLMKGFASIALPLDYPVRTMDDWLKLKPWFEYAEARFGEGWEAHARKALQEDQVLVASIPGGFSLPRELMGEESLCLGYYEEPELLHDILATLSETSFRVLERVSRTVPIDVLNVHEDMAGRSGPLAGPRQVREFIAPYYRRIWDLVHERGTRLFEQDSDGDMAPVLDEFITAGLNCTFPVEPAAGMDPVKIRETYGTRLAMYGGIDKHVLRQSKAAIDRELEYKLPPLIKTGGYIIALDHRIPNGTPLDNYRHYVGKVWEIIGREAR